MLEFILHYNPLCVTISTKQTKSQRFNEFEILLFIMSSSCDLTEQSILRVSQMASPGIQHT